MRKENGRRAATLPRVSVLQAPAGSMNSRHKAMRAKLSAMAPRRAVEFILSCELPDDEAACVIECDVRGKSCVQVAAQLHVSVDGLYKIRRRAYAKISDQQGEGVSN